MRKGPFRNAVPGRGKCRLDGYERAARLRAAATAFALALLGALGALGTPAPAAAFSAPSVYQGSATEGGGGGRWFTGSPAEGYGCSACHTADPGQPEYEMGVTGIPVKGYSTDDSYWVVLDWPQFAARWAQLRPDPSVAPAVGMSPAVGLLAEFVPENGQASGTIELDASIMQAQGLCEKRRPNSKDRLGASLYQVRPGVDPIEIEADEEGIMRCEAQRLGQRCIVALASCGAHLVQFRWYPPDSRAPGPIWFSAGFVATDFLSGTPQGDSVFEYSVPMVPIGSPSDSYEAVLEGAPCSVRSPGALDGSPLGTVPMAAVGVAAWWSLRRRRRNRRGRGGPR